MELCKIMKSDRKDKKYVAMFREKTCPCSVNLKKPECGGKQKLVHFGAKGMSDFTKHKDEERKKNYIQRHQVNEDWTDPYKAGTLSRYILWNKPSLEDSIKDYKKRFNV